MVFEQLIAAFDVVFAPLAVFQPILSVFLISTLLTVIIVVLNKLVVDRKLVKEIKDKMEEIRENLTRAQKEGNKEETNKFFAEMMKVNNQYMKHTFKALIISLIVIALFLPWVKYKYEGMIVATLPFSLPVIGANLTWLYWYILVSFAIGWVINRIVGSP